MKLNNIEIYTLGDIYRIKDAYKEQLKKNDGIDICFPGLKFKV